MIKKGDRLPFFRLATLGGTSVSRDDLQGRPALYFGWASWDPSRETLPALQAFAERQRDRIQVVTIAFDVQGPDHPMRYLRAARFSFAALIDASCELSRLWGVTSIPFAVAADADAIIRLVTDESPPSFLEQVPAALAKKADKVPPERKITHPQPDFEILLQSCTNLLGRGRKEEALVALQQAMALDPANDLVRKQMWAVAHPERFYQGAIDLAWQKAQEDATRTVKPKKRP
ncbi:MAG: TlpA family protein disulfide reductase [Planctomycetes bacterium]|nr:TlpA family protein disulfide reductase [Planctomycetota bacterium]